MSVLFMFPCWYILIFFLSQSEDELQSTLPELTGPKCINGLSWEFYKTPILLLDEANSAFQVTQDDAHARYIDLVTCVFPQFKHGFCNSDM